MWWLYWEEFLKLVKMEDYEWILDHLNTLLEGFCHEFDDIDSIDKTRIEERTKVRKEALLMTLTFSPRTPFLKMAFFSQNFLF